MPDNNIRLIDASKIDLSEVFVGNDATSEELKTSVQELIDSQPTVKIPIEKHGYWTEKKCGDGMFDYYFVCSECHKNTPRGAYPIAPDFCPNCGAVMDINVNNLTPTLDIKLG